MTRMPDASLPLPSSLLIHISKHKHRFCIHIKCDSRCKLAFYKVFVQIVYINFYWVHYLSFLLPSWSKLSLSARSVGTIVQHKTTTCITSAMHIITVALPLLIKKYGTQTNAEIIVMTTPTFIHRRPQ